MSSVDRPLLWGIGFLALVAVPSGCSTPIEPSPSADRTPSTTAMSTIPTTPPLTEPLHHDGHDHPDLGIPSSMPPKAEATGVAVRFAQAWVRRDLPQSRWWSGVAELSTGELATALYTTDPGNVPASKVTGAPVRKEGGPTPEYAVPTNGGTLLLTLGAGDDGWVVGDVDFVRAVQ